MTKPPKKPEALKKLPEDINIKEELYYMAGELAEKLKKLMNKSRAKEVIQEKLKNPDEKLSGFVSKRSKEKYTGQGRAWGIDFCHEILGLDKGKLEKSPYVAIVYVMALQTFLSNKVEKSFELKDNRNAQIDGKMNFYTFNVLALHLNLKGVKPKFDLVKPDDSYRKKPGVKDAEAHLAELQKATEVLMLQKEKEAKAKVLEAQKLAETEKEKETQSEQLAKTVAWYLNYMLGRIERAHKEQLSDYSRLMKKKERDPSTWFLNFDDISGSWPDLAFKEYEREYLRVGGQIHHPSAVEAFERLQRAVRDYYKYSESFLFKLRAEYKRKIRKELVDQYDLPGGIDLTDFSPIAPLPEDSTPGEGRGAAALAHVMLQPDSSQFRAQKRKIEFSHLTEPEKIDKFYSRYFSEYPKTIFGKWDDLVSSLKKPELAKILIKDFPGYGQEAIRKQVNEVIRLRNMHTIHSKTEEFRGQFREALHAGLKKLDTYYADYYKKPKPKHGTELVAHLLPKEFQKAEADTAVALKPKKSK